MLAQCLPECTKHVVFVDLPDMGNGEQLGEYEVGQAGDEEAD
jgi:hypothetical protein